MNAVPLTTALVALFSDNFTAALRTLFRFSVLADIGLKWSELSKVLNPNYNWEAAIQAASVNNDPLDEV